MVPISRMGKTETRSCPAGGHTAGSRQGWELNPGLGDVRASHAAPMCLLQGVPLPFGTPSGAKVPEGNALYLQSRVPSDHCQPTLPGPQAGSGYRCPRALHSWAPPRTGGCRSHPSPTHPSPGHTPTRPGRQ